MWVNIFDIGWLLLILVVMGLLIQIRLFHARGRKVAGYCSSRDKIWIRRPITTRINNSQPISNMFTHIMF